MHPETQQPIGRQHARAGVDLYVNKIIGDEPHLVRVRDISVGGVYLYKLLEPHAADGEQVGLEMQLPNCDEIIWAVGEVVRKESTDGMAIRFVRMAEADRKLIAEYVATGGRVETTQAA